MNFAIVGETSDTTLVVDALHRSAEHAVTHAACLSDDSGLLTTSASLRRVGEWEDLLADESIDGVVVSGHEDLVLPPARQIASSGRPLVVVPSPGMGSSLAYELSLVRDENLVPLYPVLRHRLDPAANRLKELIQSGQLGDVIQLRLEREISNADTGLLTQPDVETWLQPDAGLLRWMGGAFTQVTALYQGTNDAGFATGTINLAGDSATDSTWVLSRSASPKWKLIVSGSKQQAVLEHDGSISRVLLDGDAQTLSNQKQESTAAEWIESLPAAIANFTSENTSQADRALVWTDFTRSHEIVDAHRRSIKRRRTIDMHFETLSERSQFKTQMSAMGCGILTYTLFGMVAYLVVAGAFAPDEGAAQAQKDRFALLCNIAKAVWILPLSVFLASQLLLLIAKPSAKPTAE